MEKMKHSDLVAIHRQVRGIGKSKVVRLYLLYATGSIAEFTDWTSDFSLGAEQKMVARLLRFAECRGYKLMTSIRYYAEDNPLAYMLTNQKEFICQETILP